MEFVRVDTQRAYQLIREKITRLALAPGAPIREQALTDDLDMELTPIHEALKLLAHDGLVTVTAKGVYVADVDVPDLKQLSELRLLLESYSAQQAAERATHDDLAVLDALCAEAAGIGEGESERLFDVDHKFHQVIAQAAHNKYLAASLESFFALSQRLWYLVLPELEFLPAAVGTHVEMVEAIKQGDGERAAEIMREHVKDFYDRVHEVLAERGG